MPKVRLYDTFLGGLHQGMFGNPHAMTSDKAIFNLVWTYNNKALDGRKKACCTCDGSPHSGMVRILDKTYTNCVEQTSSRLFYAISAAENLLIYGADVSNAFAEAPPPQQGFFIWPDHALHEWWTIHLKCPPIPNGHVIPILSAMQGHPESPHLWEKHADTILREIELIPTVHKPCLYSGIIDGKHVIFKCQVDDFAIATLDKHMADILLGMLDDRQSIPIKCQGYLDMFHGINVTQTCNCIKIDCHSFIEKACKKYLMTWMHTIPIMDNQPTPLPTDQNWLKKFNAAVGSSNKDDQDCLAKEMKLNYPGGVGEHIWVMTTCRSDLAFTSIKLSQSNSCPHEHHYHGLHHALQYLYKMQNNGLHFWQTSPCMELPVGPIP
jgi:hypothetical protein